MRYSLLWTSACCAFLLLVPNLCKADLVFGLDAKAETSGPANDATYNVFNGLGVDIAAPTNVTSWISATGGYGPNFNVNNANIFLNGGTQSSFDVTYEVNLTGTHEVTFDKFAVSMQRGGNATSNVVSNAMYSTDGVNFFNLLVEEVAVGGNGGGNNVGPADTITSFRTPNGFGGTINPQQTYVVSGLGAAGALDSGSLFVKYSIGTSSSGTPGLTVLTDRYDLTTTAMALAAANSTDLGADDGYDMAWYGTVVPVPEPTSAALIGAIGLGFISRRRRS